MAGVVARGEETLGLGVLTSAFPTPLKVPRETGKEGINKGGLLGSERIVTGDDRWR